MTRLLFYGMSHWEDKLIHLPNNVTIENWINIACCNDLRFAKRTKFAAFRPANRQVDAAWTLFNRSDRSRVNVFSNASVTRRKQFSHLFSLF